MTKESNVGMVNILLGLNRVALRSKQSLIDNTTFKSFWEHRTAKCWLCWFFVSFFLSTLTTANCAEVFRESASRILLVGEIEDGDLDKIRNRFCELVDSADKPVKLGLCTAGGNVLEAIRIGEFAREALLPTEVHESGYVGFGRGKCFSAGIFIVVGSPIRSTFGTYGRFEGVDGDPHIGVHRPYFEPKHFSGLSAVEASDAYRVLENGVRKYFSDMGAPNAFVEMMFRISSSDIKYLTDEQFEEYFPKKEAFVDEWLRAKCTYLTKAENELYWEYRDRISDSSLEVIVANRDLNLGLTNEEILDKATQLALNDQENIDYENLNSTWMARIACEESAILEHQRSYAQSFQISDKD